MTEDEIALGKLAYRYTSDGWLSNMPPKRRLRSSLTHQLDVRDRQSQCATVMETEPSPLLVLGCRTVCQQTLLRVTRFHSSAEKLQSYPDILL